MLGQFQTPSFNARNETTTSTALTLTKSHDLVTVTGAVTMTLPSIAALAQDGIGDKAYKIVNGNSSTATVTITANSLDKINDGSSAGASSVYLYDVDDYVILQANLAALKWEYVYPSPRISVNDYVKDDTIGGVKTVMSKFYSAVAALTTGTTAVNVFGSGGAPCALTLTSIMGIAADTVASTQIMLRSGAGGTTNIAEFAKSTTAGAVTGDASLTSTLVAVTSGDTVTVQSVSTGNALCLISFTVP